MKKRLRRTTLFDLVKAVQDSASSDAETVLVLERLFSSGRAVLHGSARRQLSYDFIA